MRFKLAFYKGDFRNGDISVKVESSMRPFSLAIPFILIASTAGLACSPSDIQVKQASWVRKGSGQQFLRVVGEIVNHCADATGVQLKAVFRDGSGNVVTTTEFWPASIRNIPAGSAYAFEQPADGDRPVTALELNVIETRRW